MKKKMMNNDVRNGSMPMPISVPTDIKPYNIAVDEENDSAEINLYGEVVSNVPTNFWTGEKIEGLYIVLSDFLNDIETLRDKSDVTFRINSPGGEVFAGVAIYNRMKEFTGNVTTIVDGLAASAASIIALGGKTRKVCNGSLTMIHGASSLMIGYFNSNEIKDKLKQVDAIDKSIVDIYEKETGLEREKIKNMMSKTTWMNAQEAVDNGFAESIVDGTESVTMSLNENRKLLMVNGIPMNVQGLVNLPDNIPINKVSAVNKKTKNITGGSKKMTLEELTQQEPDLVNQIRNDAIAATEKNQAEAINNAVSAEVSRLQSIDEIADKIADKSLVNKAKYGETKMSAGDLALEALKAQQDAGAAFLKASAEDGKASGADSVQSSPTAGTDAEQAKNDIDAGAALIAGIVK